MPDELPEIVMVPSPQRGTRTAMVAALLALAVSLAGGAVIWSNSRADITTARERLAEVQLQNDDLNDKLTALIAAQQRQADAAAQTATLTGCRLRNSTEVDVFVLGYFKRLLTPPVDVNALLTELDGVIARRAQQGQVAGQGVAVECAPA